MAADNRNRPAVRAEFLQDSSRQRLGSTVSNRSSHLETSGPRAQDGNPPAWPNDNTPREPASPVSNVIGLFDTRPAYAAATSEDLSRRPGFDIRVVGGQGPYDLAPAGDLEAEAEAVRGSQVFLLRYVRLRQVYRQRRFILHRTVFLLDGHGRGVELTLLTLRMAGMQLLHIALVGDLGGDELAYLLITVVSRFGYLRTVIIVVLLALDIDVIADGELLDRTAVLIERQGTEDDYILAALDSLEGASALVRMSTTRWLAITLTELSWD